MGPPQSVPPLHSSGVRQARLGRWVDQPVRRDASLPLHPWLKSSQVSPAETVRNGQVERHTRAPWKVSVPVHQVRGALPHGTRPATPCPFCQRSGGLVEGRSRPTVPGMGLGFGGRKDAGSDRA